MSHGSGWDAPRWTCYSSIGQPCVLLPSVQELQRQSSGTPNLCTIR